MFQHYDRSKSALKTKLPKLDSTTESLQTCGSYFERQTATVVRLIDVDFGNTFTFIFWF